MPIEDLVFKMVGVSHQEGEVGKAPLKGIIKLIRKAQSRVTIVSGELVPAVYCSDKFLDTVRAACERDVVFEIVAGPTAKEASIKCLRSLMPCVSIYRLSERPTYHFMVIDGKHLRIEKHHAADELIRDQYILMNDKDAPRHEKAFEKLKREGQLVKAARGSA